MMKIISTILVIHALAGAQANEDIFQVIDSLLTPLMPIGMADTPLVENGQKLKKLCEIINTDFLRKQTDKVASLTKGLIGRCIESSFAQFSTDKVTICQLTKRDELDKATAMAKEYNRHGVEAEKVRLSFFTALHELSQKSTKAVLPTLACYFKEVSDKFIGVYPDKDGAKEFVKSICKVIFNDIYGSVFEKEGIKAIDNCPLPKATTNPFKYNSIFIANFNAVLTLQDK